MFELIIGIPFMAFLALPVLTLWLTRDAPAVVHPHRGWLQVALWIHFVVLGLFYSLLSLLNDPTGDPVIPVFTAVASLTALYWLAFENVDPDNPDHIPFGLKALVLLKYKPAVAQYGHLVPEDVTPPLPNPLDIASQRARGFAAKLKEEQLKAQTDAERAEQSALREARARNEERLRTEELRRRARDE